MAFYIKQGNTSPAILRQLQDAGGAPVNLAGASVRFSMASPDGTVRIARAVAAVFTGALPGGGMASAVDGWMRYAWAVGDTAIAGQFNAEFEVTYADASVETAPNAGYEAIHIEKKLA